MGRTQRRRNGAKRGNNQKRLATCAGCSTTGTNITISLNREIKGLVAWMNSLGSWLKYSSILGCPRLQLTDFVGSTGRGLMATQDIPEGCPIVSVPLSLVVSRSTALKALKKSFGSLTTHELLAAFLMLERASSSSSWRPYLESLPKAFDVPYYCSQDEVGLFPSYLKSASLKQRLELVTSFNRVSKAAAAAAGDGLAGSCWRKIGDFANAYFVVNTRAVYFNEELGREASSSQDQLALVPFLDMFNHSCEARVEAGPDLVQSSVRSYQIVTKKPVKKGHQVFINYGAHTNLKLYVEYGFVVPGSLDDSVPIDLEDLEKAIMKVEEGLLPEMDRLCQKSFEIIEANGLSQNMRVDCDGCVSWNVGAAFFIVCQFLDGRDDDSSWRSAFSQSEFDESSKINVLIDHLLRQKLDEVQKSREALLGGSLNHLLSSSSRVALALLTCHSQILEVAIELQIIKQSGLKL